MSETLFTPAGFEPGDFDMGVHQEMARSQDYSNRDTYPDHRLYKLILHWQQESRKPERSPRSREEVNILLGRLSFEIRYRHTEDEVNGLNWLDDNLKGKI